MNYYKVIQNDKIINVLEDPVWVKQNKRDLIVRCDIADATGVLSIETDTIWHIAGKKPFTKNDYEDVSLADITEDEAEELKVLLNLGADISDTDNGENVDWVEDEKEEEILPEDSTLDEVKAHKLAILSNECRQTIYDGVDVEMSDGTTQHFALEIEDQLNLITLSALVESGETAIPYHASDSLCVYYSAEDIMRIVNTATSYKTYHTSYYNSLKNWVMSMDNIVDVGSVSYGDDIPAEYCSDVLIALISGEAHE